MKRLLSFLLALVLLLSIVPVSAQAAKGGKLVALTFDDGPHSSLTEQLLDGLKERGVHVTFFMQGYMAQDNIDVVQRVYDEGHEVANHTWNHPEMTSISNDSIKSQISRTTAVLDTVCGKGTRYLVRPPYGSTNSRVRSAIGAPLIHWSVDTNDWQYGYSHVYNHILNYAYDGAIILCHDIHSSTIPAALDAIDVLLARGYEFVTVSELYRRRGVELKNGVEYRNLKPNGVDYGPVEKPVITYQDAQGGGIRVTITSPSGAPVYYSTDGSKLDQESTRYSSSFVLYAPCTVKAVAAFNMNGGRSVETSVKITKFPCEKPTIRLENGKVAISTTTKGAEIYYSTNGSMPTTDTGRYWGPITLQPGTVIRAVAGGGNFRTSEDAKAYYSANRGLYADVMPNEWYAGAVIKAAEMGLLAGVGDYRYAPEENMTRGMMVAVLYRSVDEKLGKGWKRTNSFKDVSGTEWYAEAIEWAYRNDIVIGCPGNVFNPNQPITRQEMALMVVNYFDYCGSPLPEGNDCRSNFKDGNKVADWALNGVNAVVSAGLMMGSTNKMLRPSDATTRAECCSVIVRAIELRDKMEN